jgi:L-ascorbate metabolism protein UlaG (beta-lactamase superfamily)
VFSDVALIQELHEPKIAMVPVGDRFTMGARSAAFAVKRFLKLDAVIPCHYGSFPIIAQTADGFVAEMKEIQGHTTKVIVPEKGKAFSV